MAKEAICRKLHVLITKPAVKKLEEHRELIDLANQNNVLFCVEVHKRFDPMYSDSQQRIKSLLGEFSYFYSYMSQPKSQLITFKDWAGTSSDISYYLNSHHVDFHCWCMKGIAVPEKVVAMGSEGVCNSEKFNFKTEDTITLLVQWRNINSGNIGTAVYTASWVSPKSDVHSQQRFFYLGTQGEINIDQAHRGYTMSTDQGGFSSVNPLYMKYTPSLTGHFSGQQGYGYKSIEEFVVAATHIINGEVSDPSYYEKLLPTIKDTLTSTAILHAGRISLDNGGESVKIEFDDIGPIGYSMSSKDTNTTENNQ